MGWLNGGTESLLLMVGCLFIAAWLGHRADLHAKKELERELKRAGQMAAGHKYDIACMKLINELRDPEGWAIELVCDNPSPKLGGPMNVISVFGEWPVDESKPGPWEWEWDSRSFTGTGLLDCLQAAHSAISMRAPYRSAGE